MMRISIVTLYQRRHRTSLMCSQIYPESMLKTKDSEVDFFSFFLLQIYNTSFLIKVQCEVWDVTILESTNVAGLMDNLEDESTLGQLSRQKLPHDSGRFHIIFYFKSVHSQTMPIGYILCIWMYCNKNLYIVYIHFNLIHPPVPFTVIEPIRALKYQQQ